MFIMIEYLSRLPLQNILLITQEIVINFINRHTEDLLLDPADPSQEGGGTLNAIKNWLK